MQITEVPVRLTKDPDQIRTVKTKLGSKLVVSFQAAHNWRERKSDGSYKDVGTTFFRCTLWEEDGASVFADQDFSKGDLIRVSGTWTKRSWVRDDGQIRVDDEIRVSKVTIRQDAEISRETTEVPEPSADDVVIEELEEAVAEA